MPGKGQRLAVVILAIALALISFNLLSEGLTALGVIGLMIMVIVVGVGTSASRMSKLLETKSSPVELAKPAAAPPDGHIRFTIVVEGAEPSRLAEVWTDLCRPGRETTEAFRRLFQDFTVLEGNRFRFRKGDPNATAALLKDVLKSASGVEVRTSLEPAAERTPIWS